MVFHSDTKHARERERGGGGGGGGGGERKREKERKRQTGRKTLTHLTLRSSSSRRWREGANTLRRRFGWIPRGDEGHEGGAGDCAGDARRTSTTMTLGDRGPLCRFLLRSRGSSRAWESAAYAGNSRNRTAAPNNDDEGRVRRGAIIISSVCAVSRRTYKHG